MFRKNFDLLLVGLLTLVAVILAWAGVNNGAAQFLFGVPLVLFIPGYVLVEALSGPGMERSKRLLFSFGLSLLLAIVGGLLLNITPWGLRPETWATWLGLITLLAGTKVALQRRANPSPEPLETRRPLSNFKWTQVGLMGAAALVLVAAIVVARSGAAVSASDDPFTQLWAIPDQQASLIVGVLNEEGSPQKYKVQVVAGTTVIKEWASLELGSDQKWETTLSLAGAQTGADPVEVKLYRLDKSDTVYRQVFISPSQP